MNRGPESFILTAFYKAFKVCARREKGISVEPKFLSGKGRCSGEEGGLKDADKHFLAAPLPSQSPASSGTPSPPFPPLTLISAPSRRLLSSLNLLQGLPASLSGPSALPRSGELLLRTPSRRPTRKGWSLHEVGGASRASPAPTSQPSGASASFGDLPRCCSHLA